MEKRMTEYQVVTDRGGKAVNEDCWGVSQKDGTIYVVADGLGGHGHGEIASRIMVDNVIAYFENCDTAKFDLADAVCYGHEKIREYQQTDSIYSQIRTTAVVLYIDNNVAQCAHVGDSRCYYFKKNKIAYQTRDHSMIEVLIRKGQLPERARRNNNERNSLLRAVGDDTSRLKVEVSDVFNLEAGDAFLLCTDGLWDYVLEKEMTKLLRKSKDIKLWIPQMINIVNKKCEQRNISNNDNYTGLAVMIK